MLPCSARIRYACLALWLGLGIACGVPRIAVDSVPTGAALYVNGHRRGKAPEWIPAPYFGSYRLEALLEVDPSSLPRQAEQVVVLREPVTPWIFPFDFVFEMLLAPFSHRDLEVSLPLPAQERAPPSREPQSRPQEAHATDHDALLQRARALGLVR